MPAATFSTISLIKSFCRQRTRSTTETFLLLTSKVTLHLGFQIVDSKHACKSMSTSSKLLVWPTEKMQVLAAFISSRKATNATASAPGLGLRKCKVSCLKRKGRQTTSNATLAPLVREPHRKLSLRAASQYRASRQTLAANPACN